ncbi:MAG: glycosyltransferase, partial [Steroidobacteraceae bacterium]
MADLTTASQQALTELLREGWQYELSGRLTVAVDRSASDKAKSLGCHVLALQSPHEALSHAIALAAGARRHLLVLLGGAIVGSDVVGSMLSAFAADPMIGYVVPRFADPSGDQIVPIRYSHEPALPAYDRSILSHLPDIQLAPEFLAACILIRDRLVANFPDIDRGSWSIEGALLMAMTATRRWGFRTAIANKVVAPHPVVGSPYLKLAADEFERICLYSPHTLNGAKRLDALALHQREPLLARALSPDPEQRQRLLLDCSNIQPLFNGTAEVILGLLNGFAALRPLFSFDVIAHDEAVKYHRLRERHPQFRFIEKPTRAGYLAAIRLSQPWAMETIVQLHESALYVVATMLDTISWDIVNGHDHEVEQAWSFAARHLDGLIYISNFSRDRFRQRFPLASHVRELVSYLSCNSDDYGTALTTERQAREYILVVGNSYDHKALAPTMEVLADAFPFENFVVIGMDWRGRSNVQAFASGHLSPAEVDRIYAQAQILVFPSFYEGFGFPILRGLAHGVDVVARHSSLLEEIAANCAGSGRIVAFEDPLSLVEAVGRLLAGDPVEALPLGGRIPTGARPANWREIAARIITFVEDLAAKPSAEVYDQRDAALRMSYA